MYKALVVKELRESAGLIAVGVLAAAWILSDLTGVKLLPLQSGAGSVFPFVSDTALTLYLCLLAGGLALMFGFKQSAWELWQGSYFFLLHRPVSRRTIFSVKLAVGLAVLLGITGSVIQVYAMWAATPGTHASPFFWSMTLWAWQYWLACAILYFGAFLSGIRPGRWFGSRLFPLVAAALFTLLAAIAPWWWLNLVLVVGFSAALLASIFYYVETRDY